MISLSLPLPLLTRRGLLSLGAAGLVCGLCGCGQRQSQGPAPTATSAASPSPEPARPTAVATPTVARATPDDPGRIRARPPTNPPGVEAQPGTTTLGLSITRDSLLYVPAGYDSQQPAPLAVMLHGAGGRAEQGLSLIQDLADQSGLLVLALASRGQTWDIILGGYGPDVEQLDRALEQVFASYTVDPTRIAIGGFSDGASYALSIGLMNGELFSHIIAFSPGFMAPERLQGQPQIFVSHGIRDDVLPIDRCSRQIVPLLEAAGYNVSYQEFDGPHTVPDPIAEEAIAWFTAEA